MPKIYKPIKTDILIEKLVPGGSALGTISNPSSPEHGKKVFLWNALPEETVTLFQPTKKKSSYLEGIALEIKNPSKYRVSPKDPCYLSTSPWQILSFSQELTQKELLVKESLTQAHVPLNSNLSIAPIKTDQTEWNYRNKMEYALYWDKEKEKISLAFHARGSHNKIPITSSSIERPEILEQAQKTINCLNELHEPAYKYQSLLLRSNQKGIVSGGLLENHQPHPTFQNLSDSLLDTNYSYSPNGFFQINLPVYELALKEIENHLTTEKVLDLYSGVGTIGLSVAAEKRLTLVETNDDAFRELENNCHSKSSLYKSLNPVHAKSEEALSFISPDQTVILDPPRSGCDKKLLEKLLEEKPNTIIYLSCNPATQARDVSILTSKNDYKITTISPYNFFPKTPHIENLIVLKCI
ncbi:class I SAM-dependent RNA methyltransferase [Candidatus Saccharibacteria bacterium]|nr:class I SAM-dependent RNA methyltransferase [Candidatus Saccharibacteria bacterium]